MAVDLQAQAPSKTSGQHEFPIGFVRRVDDLPPGRFRSRLEELPSPARDRALAWLRSFQFCEHDLPSLRVDPNGGVFYADPAHGDPVGPGSGASPDPAAAAVPVNPFPAALVFHSRPGAPNVLYIDFTGETVSSTEWNTVVGRSSIPAQAFSLDSDPATFSDAEQLAIRRVWERVSEDYAPFNIDVTTERPATFNNRTAHALVTGRLDANGEPNPSSGSGGVGYVNVFGTSSYARYRPAWIYHDNLANDESIIAEAVSHEVGHNLGLSHDGTTAGAEYYGGHGSGDTSWGPIMGGGYYRNVSQWSRGEYYRANNTQDDLATIAGKVSYRGDDHGGSAVSATPLVLTGGTNIVSTTPATDPTNTSPANKGVLAQGSDVDVFSFVTGAGPVRLRVTPWVSPGGGIRGGNLDVRLLLYNEQGALLQTVDPAARTDAQVDASLAAGRYYLHVRNSAAGDPLSATPTGYAAYGSLGQYFIEGFVTASVGAVLPPVAELAPASVTGTGQGALTLRVTYSDDQGVKVSTLDGADLRVTGPNGFNRFARFVGVDVGTDGTPRVATYAVDPPGTAWMPSDNGVYSVALESGQVADVSGAFAAPAVLGQFGVSVPVAYYLANMTANPGWTLQGDWEYGTPTYGASGPQAGFTGSRIIGYNLSGDYPSRLAPTYATTPLINTVGSSSLTLRFRRWLRVQVNDTASIDVSTNGTAWTRLWTSPRRVADSGWQAVQYPLPPGFAGSPSLRVRWGLASNASQNDIGWNLDDVELVGDGVNDSAPPTAVLNVADLSQGGSPSHSCSVTFTDASAVRLASLDSGDIAVSGPNGFTGTIEFIGADLPADGSPITAIYSISAPGGSWDPADNGAYQVTLLGDEVTDTLNNAAAGAVLGSFTVNIPSSRQALVVSPVAVSIPTGGTAGFRVRLAESATSPVSVAVVRVGGDPSVFVASGAALQFNSANWSADQTVTLGGGTVAAGATFEVSATGLVPVTVIATVEPAPILALSPRVDGPNLIIEWTPIPGRLHTLFTAAELVGDWVPVPGAQAMPATTQSISLPIDTGTSGRLFRLSAQ